MLTVSVVASTLNEERNIKTLIRGIRGVFAPYTPELVYEIVVVDDSTDQTPVIARSCGAKVIKGRGRGLGQAIIDGIKNAKNEVVVVMDADLSHSPMDIPRLLKPILEQGAELVIGSRYVKGGDVSDWNLKRRIQSLVGVKLMQLVTGVSDSNSGFFALRKFILDGVELKPHSWKIMLEVLFKGKWVFKMEVPIKFGDRHSGVSKNNLKERLTHAVHIFRLLVWKFRRYITFACVGGIGALWYFGMLYFLTDYVGMWYGLSAIVGTLVAITNNYFINHYYTFRKERQHNKSLLRGWLKYVGNSAVGDGADWLVLVFLTEVFGLWYMLSAFIASAVASVLKYTVAKKYIWGGKARKSDDADYEWHAFFKGLPWQKRWKRIIAKIVKEFAEYPEGSAGTMLDYGCGSSPQGLLINHKDYVGVDVNAGKIDFMSRKRLSRCRFEQVDARHLLLRSKLNIYNTIICVEVLEHLENRHSAEMVLLCFYELMKDGGKLILATPNYGGFMGRWMDRLYGIFQKGGYAEEHQLKFDLLSLIALCDTTGFKYIRSKIPSGADMVCLFEKVKNENTKIP